MQKLHVPYKGRILDYIPSPLAKRCVGLEGGNMHYNRTPVAVASF